MPLTAEKCPKNGRYEIEIINISNSASYEASKLEPCNFSIQVLCPHDLPVFTLNIDLLFQIVPWDFPQLGVNTQDLLPKI